jgi:carbon-monoxide dehydrogenase large subunit
LLRGAGCYVHDVALPDTLHLVFVRSTHAHARVVSMDLDVARDSPGVVAVLTAEALGITERTMPTPNPLLPVETHGLAVPLLASDTLHYLGQPLAIVVARTRSAAQAAADLVVVEVEPLEAVLDFAGAEASTRVQYTQEAVAQTPAAAHTVQTTLHCPRVLAMTMEPRACLATWDAQSQSLTAWLGTQTPSRAQADLAAVLGVAVSQVRVISPDVGGAFGSKASVSPEDLLVGLVARHLQATVRWAASRSEDFIAGMHGRGSQLHGSLSVDAGGHFTGLSARLVFTLGAWLPFSAVVPLRNAARILPGPYIVPGIDIQGQASRSHAAPVTIYRGAGRPEAALLMETLVDKAARASGIDPAELRRRNLIPASAMPCITPTGELLDSGDYRAALDGACERFGYDAERALQQQRRAEGECVGIGLALYIEPCGQGWESARVTLDADGAVTVASGSPAQGQGHATTFAQIAATALGCTPDRVQLQLGDTALCPTGIGAMASRSTAIGGSAIVQACREVLALQRAGAAYPLVAEVRYSANEAWSYGCVIARMAIDPETGTPTVERVVWVDDAGHIVNPVLVRGQFIGGAAQGLGQALMEQLVYDNSGQLLTGSLMDYAVPRASDMPPIEIASLHIPSPHNLLGAKGVGEAGCIGLPAALMNAARDALRDFGEPELQLPLRAEQLWRAMQKPPSNLPR